MLEILDVTDDDEVSIAAMIAEARKNYLPWSLVKEGAVETVEGVLTLDKRKPGFVRPPSYSIILGTFRVSFSFEEQPAGLLRHISISTEPARPDSLPSLVAMDHICKLFGFEKMPAGVEIWVEEYEPGLYAVNAVEVAEPQFRGDAT